MYRTPSHPFQPNLIYFRGCRIVVFINSRFGSCGKWIRVRIVVNIEWKKTFTFSERYASRNLREAIYCIM